MALVLQCKGKRLALVLEREAVVIVPCMLRTSCPVLKVLNCFFLVRVGNQCPGRRPQGAQ